MTDPFADIAQADGTDPFGSIANGGPLLDRTASSNWRSTYTTPVYAEQSHDADLAASAGKPATTSLPADHFTNQPGPLSSLGKGIDFGSLGKGFVDTFSPDSENNVFKKMGRGFVAGAQQATEGVPEWGHELDSGPAGVFGKLFAPVSAVAGGALGALNAPFLDPNSEAFRKNQAGALEVLLGGAMTHTGPEPRVSPRSIASEVRPREPLALPAPRTAALPAARPQLALPEPRFRPAPDVIPLRPAVVDTTARAVPPLDLSGFKNTTISPDTAAWMKSRIAATTPAAPAVPQGLRARTGALTPIGREDLTLGRGVAKPVEPVAPVPLDSLRARIGAKDTTGIPLDAEQLSARIGAKTRPQAVNSLNNSLQVEARQARPEPGQPATGTLGSSGMSGPLVGRAVGRGNSQLARTGIGATGLEATPDNLSASLARQAKVHDANEAAIAASKSGDQTALARAKADVKLLGGDLTHTEDRINRAQRSSPDHVTTNETTAFDFQASIDALQKKKAASPSQAPQINADIARLTAELDKRVGKPAPNEVARALETEARRIMQQDVSKLPKRGLIGTRELQRDVMGALGTDVVQSEAQRGYGSGLARGRNTYSSDASRSSLESRSNDLMNGARGIRENLAVIRDAKAEILKEERASRGETGGRLSEEDRIMAKSPGFRAEMGLHDPNPEVIAAAEARIQAAEAKIAQHVADAEAQGVKTPTAQLADLVKNGLQGIREKAAGGGQFITDTKAGPQSPASSLSERPKLIGMAEIRPSMIGAKEVSDRLYRNYAGSVPGDPKLGMFDAGKALVQVVDGDIPGAKGALGETIYLGGGKSTILVKSGLPYEKFVTVIQHELEHVGQPRNMDLVSMERRAYASHGSTIPQAADRYAKNSEGWWSAGGRNSAGDIAGDTVPADRGRSLMRDSFDTMVGDAGKMSPEDIAAAKAKLADRMGVDPTTGRSGAEPRVTPRTAQAGPPPGRITAQTLTRAAENVAGTGKTLTTAMTPFHFMFRHALPFMAAHPQAWLKGSAKGLGEGFTMNPAQLDARIQTMKGNLERNGLGNVYLGKPHLGAIGGEESVSSSYLNRLGPLGKVIQRSGQGFTQGLNEVRYEAAKGAVNSSNWMAAHGLAQKLTVADRTALGDSINHFSGRGLDTANMSDTGKATMRVLNLPMFSPQLATARVRMLGDFAGALKTVTKDLATGHAPRAADIEKARLGVGYITGVGSLYLLMSAATGNKPDLNPVSSTFGQVDAGDRGPTQAAAGFLAPEIGMGFNSYDGQPSRVDPTASEATLIRHIARLSLSIYDRATGQHNLKDQTGNQQEQTPMDVASNALLSTIFTSPIGYPIAEWLRGYGVEPLDSVTPMPITGALKGAGVTMPSFGGKEKTTTGTKTPRSGPAPTRRPVAAPTRKAG